MPYLAPQQNHLLAAFPPESQHRLFPHLQRVDLPLGKVVQAPDQAARHVYFPADALLSLVTRHGASIEISVAGNEGLVGLSLFIGGETISQSRAMVQCPGSAYRLEGQLLRDEFERSFKLMILLLHYTRYLIVDVTQPTRCDRAHSIDQQICHWLLLSLDRLPGDGLRMTQQLLANMLAVPRQDVTGALARLQDHGAIGYARGQIKVQARSKLEQLSCTCHAQTLSERRAARRDLLPYLPLDAAKAASATRGARLRSARRPPGASVSG